MCNGLSSVNCIFSFHTVLHGKRNCITSSIELKESQIRSAAPLAADCGMLGAEFNMRTLNDWIENSMNFSEIRQRAALYEQCLHKKLSRVVSKRHMCRNLGHWICLGTEHVLVIHSKLSFQCAILAHKMTKANKTRSSVLKQ